MPQWLDNMVSILRDTNVPQIRGNLARWERDIEPRLIGKCALGVISCEVGLPLSYYGYEPSYDDIMSNANVPLEFYDDCILPKIEREDGDNEAEVSNIYFPIGDSKGWEWQSLYQMIWNLNDGGLSFKEIADFLEITFEGVEDT